MCQLLASTHSSHVGCLFPCLVHPHSITAPDNVRGIHSQYSVSTNTSVFQSQNMFDQLSTTPSGITRPLRAIAKDEDIWVDGDGNPIPPEERDLYPDADTPEPPREVCCCVVGVVGTRAWAQIPWLRSSRGHHCVYHYRQTPLSS